MTSAAFAHTLRSLSHFALCLASLPDLASHSDCTLARSCAQGMMVATFLGRQEGERADESAAAAAESRIYPAAVVAKIPTLEIAPGVKLPMSGLGTWQYNDTVAGEATALALSLGYTHIDTAIGYKNQVGIGKALKASSRPRDSYFITSKIPGGLSMAAATAQLELSNQQLQVKI